MGKKHKSIGYVCTVILLFTLFVVVPAANATLILGHTSIDTNQTSPDGKNDLFSNQWNAIEVTSSIDQYVTDVAIRAKHAGGGSGAVVELYDDSGALGSPGVSVLSFSTTDPVTTSYSNLSFTADSLFALGAASTYYLVVKGTLPPSPLGELHLFTTNNPITGNSSGGNLWVRDTGGNWNDVADTGQIFSFQINGTPVPEPATMVLLVSGLIGLAGFRRKFKK